LASDGLCINREERFKGTEARSAIGGKGLDCGLKGQSFKATEAHRKRKSIIFISILFIDATINIFIF
jgi:hypothetical protein